MIRRYIFVMMAAALLSSATAEATFSIIAVDTLTQEVGGGGGACYADFIRISDIHPGLGVIHSQSFWFSKFNQKRAGKLLDQGFDPQAIVDSILAGDPGIPEQRQLGVVKLSGDGALAAAFTGSQSYRISGQIVGPNYVIIANYGTRNLVDSIEAGFLRSSGDLAHKLMDAMQAGKRAGGSLQCSHSGLSAFLRVARPDDPADDPYLNLDIYAVEEDVEPVDSLQTLFEAWRRSTSVAFRESEVDRGILISPNPVSLPGKLRISWVGALEPIRQLVLIDALGRIVVRKEGAGLPGSIDLRLRGIQSGYYWCRLTAVNGETRTAGLVLE